MKDIEWTQIGDRYLAELELGRVVITPTDPPNVFRLYTASIETKAGQVVAAKSLDLETCKVWARVNLPLLDQATGKLYDCGHVLQTIEICQGLLSPEVDASHWLRIEHIKAWVGNYTGQPYEIRPIPVPEYSNFNLDWIEDGKTFYAETPYGRAVIEETREKGIIGGGIMHKARIVHRSGAIIDCYSFIDFMEAEYALKERLSTLDKPNIREWRLVSVQFTFDICARILPDDFDPIHFARLDMLSGVMHMALD